MNKKLFQQFFMVGMMGLLLAASHFVFNDSADNPAEQLGEILIKKETGIDIDLSPEK